MMGHVSIEYVLEDFGLSKKESKIYIELLKQPNLSLHEISRTCGLNRTTTHNILQQLVNKSILTKVLQDNISRYSAMPPEKFVELLEHKTKLMQTILPELNNLKEKNTQSIEVEVHQGPKGAYQIYADVFEKKGKKYFFGNFSNMIPLMKYYIPNARELRMNKSLPADLIIEPYDDDFIHSKEYSKISRMHQADFFKDFPCMCFIYDDTFSLFSHKDEISGVIIRNKNVADAMKIIFDQLWKVSKEKKL